MLPVFVEETATSGITTAYTGDWQYMVGGGAGIAGHLSVCDRVTITAMSLVTASITEPGEYASAMAAQEARRFRRNAARFRQLDALARRMGAPPKD